MTFPVGDLTIPSEWYWYILYKDLTVVILAWSLWYYTIPKELKVIKLSGSIFCTYITIVPIYFVLFYSVPFPVWVFFTKVLASSLVGFFIYKLNDRLMVNNRSSIG